MYTPSPAQTLHHAANARLFAIIFLLILVALHWLEPALHPLWRQVSEYELGKWGWLMRTAYFAWGGGLLLISLAAWPWLQSTKGVLGKWWLIVLGLALFGAGTFVTQPLTHPPSTMGHFLHAAFSAIHLFTFPLTTMLITASLISQEKFRPYTRTLILASLLAWLGLLAFFTAMTLFRDQIRSGIIDETVWIGLPNRFMVVSYVSWIFVMADIFRAVAKTDQQHQQDGGLPSGTAGNSYISST